MNVVYSIFSTLDWIIYNICSIVYNVIFRVIYFDVFREGNMASDIIRRVYLVLGIVMVFKLTMAAIQYIINPDTFDDKEKGLVGILKNAIITVLLIAMVPVVFDFAIDIQIDVVKAIPQILLGKSHDDMDRTVGEQNAFTVLSSFVKVKDKDEDKYCVGSKDECGNKCPDKCIQDINSFREKIGEGVTIISDAGGHYTYMYIISTAAGIFLGYMLLSMSFDLAIRTFKLNIIRILSPIPISSYMFKKDNFNKFVKTSFQVYTDLFIRMAIVYLIISLLKFVPQIVEGLFGDGGVPLSVTNQKPGTFLDWLERSLTTIVLIFGLLMFASKAPKFITDLLGLPEIGSGDLKEMFKPFWQRAAAPAAQLVNPFTQAFANARQAKKNNEGAVGMFKRALGGFTRGTYDSLASAANGENLQQIRERHKKAQDRSNERSLKHVKKRDARQRFEEDEEFLKKQQSEVIKKRHELMEQMYDMTDPSLATEAESNYEKRKNSIQQAIRDAKTPEERARLLKEQKLLNTDKNEWLLGEKERLAKEKAKKAAETQYNTEESEMRRRINAATSDEEKARLMKEYTEKGFGNKDQWIQKKVEESANERALTKQLAPERDKLMRAEAEVRNAREALARGGLSDEEQQRKLKIISDNQAIIDASRNKIDNITGEFSKKPALDAYNDASNKLNATLQQFGITDGVYDEAKIDTSINSLATEIEVDEGRFMDMTDDEKVEFNNKKQELERLKNLKVTAKSQEDARVVALNNFEEKKHEADAKRAKNEAAIGAQLISSNDQENKLDEQIRNLERERRYARVDTTIIQDGFSQMWNSQYLGGTPVRGSAYSSLASQIGQDRSSIFTGEAMAKLSQNANILVDDNGNEATFTTAYGSNKNYTYSQIRSLYQRMNTLTESDLKEAGFTDVSMVESAFKDIEKKAATAYVDANILAGSSRSGELNASATKYHLRDGTVPNSMIVEWYNNFEEALYKSNAPPQVVREVLSEFRKDPGKWIKDASGVKDMIADIAKRFIDPNNPGSGGNK